MRSCWREIPRIKAERMLASADAAQYPHLTFEGRGEFRRFWTDRVVRPIESGKQAVQFTYNGKTVPFYMFRRTMKRALGVGLEQ